LYYVITTKDAILIRGRLKRTKVVVDKVREMDPIRNGWKYVWLKGNTHDKVYKQDNQKCPKKR
jgi:hypothetical protein